jgi:xylulokinase
MSYHPLVLFVHPTFTTEKEEERKKKIIMTHTPTTCPSRLLWLKRHEPETFAKVKHVMLPHDYVNFWLTGRIVAEVSEQGSTGKQPVP